jgi:hypothetical protein
MAKKSTGDQRPKLAASAAAKILRDPKSSKDAKTTAAGSLTQSPPKKPTLASGAKISDAVRRYYAKTG